MYHKEILYKYCLLEADKSNCKLVHFGTIIVKDRIGIGWGHNRSLNPEGCCLKNKGYKMGSNVGLCYAVHAEWMALNHAYEHHSSNYVKGADLYIAGKYPDGRIRKHAYFSCTVCIRLLKLAGIKGIWRIGPDGEPLYLPIQVAFDNAYEELVQKQGGEIIKK